MNQAEPTAGAPGAAEEAVGSASPVLAESFTAASVGRVRHAVAVATAQLAGGMSAAAEDFVLAVNELVTNAVRHGGGHGDLELRRVGDSLVCVVVDYGGHGDTLAVRNSGNQQEGGRGLWLAHQLTGTLMLTHRPDGVTATVSFCVDTSDMGSGPNGSAAQPGAAHGSQGEHR